MQNVADRDCEVICVGNLVADLVGTPIDRLPPRGKQALVERMELHAGGCAANTGISLAKLGVRTSVIGKVGSDGLGDFVLGRLCAAGCEVGGVRRDEVASTSSTMALVHSDGERSFLHHFGANATLCEKDIDYESLTSAKIVMIAGALTLTLLDGEPTARLLKRAKVSGQVTALDIVWDAKDLWMSRLACCLQYVDFFFPNLSEAKMLAPGIDDVEKIADFFLERGVGTIVIKMGECGSYAKTQKGVTILTPALKVDALDGLGAGDAFNAGFLASTLKGESLEESLKFASAVGATCVRELGATTGVLSYTETLDFMQSYAKAKR